jgi:hypothetical protein
LINLGGPNVSALPITIEKETVMGNRAHIYFIDETDFCRSVIYVHWDGHLVVPMLSRAATSVEEWSGRSIELDVAFVREYPYPSSMSFLPFTKGTAVADALADPCLENGSYLVYMKTGFVFKAHHAFVDGRTVDLGPVCLSLVDCIDPVSDWYAKSWLLSNEILVPAMNGSGKSLHDAHQEFAKRQAAFVGHGFCTRVTVPGIDEPVVIWNVTHNSKQSICRAVDAGMLTETIYEKLETAYEFDDDSNIDQVMYESFVADAIAGKVAGTDVGHDLFVPLSVFIKILRKFAKIMEADDARLIRELIKVLQRG